MNPFSRGAATRSYDHHRVISSLMLVLKQVFFVMRQIASLQPLISPGVAAPRLVDLLIRVPGAYAPGYCMPPLRGWEVLSVSIVLPSNSGAFQKTSAGCGCGCASPRNRRERPDVGLG